MTDVGRRAYLMCSLPAPAIDNTLMAPLQSADTQLNNRLVCWWAGRRDLCTAVRNLQTATLRKEKSLVDLLKQLHIILQCTTALETEWLAIFRTLYARGGTLPVYSEFIPRWCILAPIEVHIIYDYDRDHAHVVPPVSEITQHSAALIFECVGLALLQAALLQQMATVTQMLERSDEANALLVKPTNMQAIELLRRALSVLKQLVEETLPMYADTRTGDDTFLLSQHFYLQCVGRIMRAQLCHALALEQHTAMAGESAAKSMLIDAAALLAQSAALLGAATLTPYVDRTLITSLAQYRRATALLTLAQLFSMGEREPETDTPLEYDARVQGDQRAQAVEAYYCARAAVVLACSVRSMQNCFADTGDRLQTIYGINVPNPSTIAAGPPQHVVEQVLSAAVGRTDDAQWCAEFGTIELSVEFECIESSIVAMHAPQRSNILGRGSVRQFLLKSAASMK